MQGMKMPSVMAHNFSQVPSAEIQRSSFKRSHSHKTVFDFGKLIPIFCDEVLPGDTFNLKMSGFGRLATPLHPIMDNMFLDTHFFFVPARLVWDNFQKFMGEQTDPGDSTDFLVPTLESVNAVPIGSLADHFGLPTGVANLTSGVNSLPFRAYNLIWNEWFRDENLQDSYPVPRDDGPDAWGIDLGYASVGGLPLPRGKRHDYFTSCLPWPQKGEAVSLPLGTSANVFTDGSFGDLVYVDVPGGGASKRSLEVGATNVQVGAALPTDVNLFADLSTATAATINQLREAFQIQRLLEKDARGGTRYAEILRSHFGVTSPDSRIQRPEYLGGGSTRVSVMPVAQTSSTDATSPQGGLAAVGTVGFSDNGFSKSFVEHGYIIGLVSARSDLTYQQGLDRMWSRSDRYDFYWPSLAHLGEQAVLNKEIYAQGTSADDEVFGYQERFAEYRYKNSLVTGAFRSSAASSLDSWHLSQDFASLPVLGDTFIQENPPVDRCIAVPTEPHIIFDSYFDLTCARPMPLFGVPGLIDHF